MTDTYFYLLYPERRRVSYETMLTWAIDAIADEEIEGPATLDVTELAFQLEDAGLITLADYERD